MIEIYASNTPNGIKIPIAAEELGIPYRLHVLDLARGDQRSPEFLAINPNGRIPAIVDRGVPVFESGAILLHLAEQFGGLIPADLEGRAATLSWLFLQVAGLGPNFGNAGHFLHSAPERISYAINRFQGEAERHLRVLNGRLERFAWLNGSDYSIADIAHFSWVRSVGYVGLTLQEHAAVQDWVARIEARPAVQRALRKMS